MKPIYKQIVSQELIIKTKQQHKLKEMFTKALIAAAALAFETTYAAW